MTGDLTPAPGPAARVQRTAGQVGGVVVLLDLWFAFGWFGADEWTPEQTSAVTAVGLLAAATVHNVAGAMRSKIEVAPVEAAPPSPEAPQPSRPDPSVAERARPLRART